jgi:hypothetical protein
VSSTADPIPGLVAQAATGARPLFSTRDELRPFLALCREGRLYEVERWLADGRPVQLDPEAIRRGYRPPSALEVAIESGQHSLTQLLLRSGYRLDIERHNPLDRALKQRRLDLFNLLLEWGADLKSADLYTVLETYNVDLYERLLAAGYDFTQGHEVGAALGYGTSNRPLLGFVKRHRAADPRFQMELNIALGCHARKGNEKGIALCLWAGADPHAPAPDIELPLSFYSEPEDGEEAFIGWSAVSEAARSHDLEVLKRLGPDPAKDDFDDLYKWAKSTAIISYLASIQHPKDLAEILEWQFRGFVHPWPGYHRSLSVIEELLSCGIRWEEPDPAKLGEIRRLLLRMNDSDLQAVIKRLKKPEVCAVDTYLELIHTPSMMKRLTTLGLLKSRGPEPKQRPAGPSAAHVDIPRRRRSLPPHRQTASAEDLKRFDREKLYEQVWSEPVQRVARSYELSGRGLAKACIRLQVPVPPRGYWARIRNGVAVKRPPLPKV